MVHPGARGSNYAKGRFDKRKLPIVPIILSLRVPNLYYAVSELIYTDILNKYSRYYIISLW